MIPNTENWIKRRHGNVGYDLTQFLGGYGGYRGYLDRFCHEDSPNCPGYEYVTEDAGHVFLHCPRFASYRIEMGAVANTHLSAQSIVELC